MKIKETRKIRYLIAGGLIVLLFLLASYKKGAILVFENGEYSIQEYAFISFQLEINIKEDIFDIDEIEFEEGWRIDEVIYGDFNNNGIEDIGIYLWKFGNYGPSTPFWVEENDDSYKQHLFVYEKKGDGYRALWHSSNLPYLNMKTFLTDINEDSENELVVLEKSYNGNLNTIAVWKWDQWGFKNIWRSRHGNFKDLKLK